MQAGSITDGTDEANGANDARDANETNEANKAKSKKGAKKELKRKKKEELKRQKREQQQEVRKRDPCKGIVAISEEQLRRNQGSTHDDFAADERRDSDGKDKDKHTKLHIASTSASASAATAASVHRVPELEQKHVREVYDGISDHWSATRFKAWPRVADFLQTLGQTDFIVDVGCGNGKYILPSLGHGLSHFEDDVTVHSSTSRTVPRFVFGLDPSFPLLELAQSKVEEEGREAGSKNRVDLATGDCVQVPLRSGCADAVLCIAVLHHISTNDRRGETFREIGRLLRPGGQALLYAWALEQPEDSKRSFPSSDCFVPWVFRERGKTYGSQIDGEFTVHRYIKAYQKGELDQLVHDYAADRLVIKESYYDKGNWCLRLERI